MQPASVPQLMLSAEDDRVKLVLANWESRIYTRKGRHHDVANNDVFNGWVCSITKHVAAAGASIVLPLIDANKLTLVAGVGGADPQRHSDNMSP